MTQRRLFCRVAAAAILGILPCPAAEKTSSKKPASDKQKSAVDEKAVRLQVWLDRQNFGPGKIDGKGGEFTKKALALYQSVHPEVSAKDDAPADFQDPVFTDYQVREEDSQHVGELPKDKHEQAKLKKMLYPSLEEFVAERFHCDPALLHALNPGLNLSALKAGDTVKVPNVIPFEIEKVHADGKKKEARDSNPRTLDIDTHDLFLKIMEADKVVAAFPITAGSERLPAPVGSWKVESITAMPEFRWDEEMLNKGERGSNAILLPPGPRNPVGVYWIGLNKKGVGVHGTDNPQTIGRSASHGCIRLANWDAVKVAPMIAAGTAVEIH